MKRQTTRPARPSPVQVGLVGLGFMGVTHLRAYRRIPGARVVAVCDPARPPAGGWVAGVNGNIGQPAAIRLGPAAVVHDSFEALLADPAVDLVDLCTPTPLHAAQAMAALRAGKHVLCEKPLARTAAEARQVRDAAAAAGKLLMPAMCMRFWPGWRWLKSALAAGQYGAVLAASFRRGSAMPRWAKPGAYGGQADPGGALFDLHIHDTDFIQGLFGLPEAVFTTGTLDQAGAITHVVTQYHQPRGPVLHAEGGWLLARGFAMSYVIHCERATLDFDFARGPRALLISTSRRPPRAPTLPGPDGYGAEVRYFVECVRRGRPPELVTAQDAVETLRVLEAEETSLRQGRLARLRAAA